MSPEAVEPVIKSGLMLCGDPEEVIGQLRIYEATGVDQVSFGVPGALSYDDTLELIETFGKHVIPEFDKDPVHSTTHFRRTAKPKFEPFNNPPPDIKTMYM